MHSSHNNRSSTGEALIVSIVTLGFFWLMSQGKFEVQNIWSYVGFLAVIVVFYFALLLCRMTFFHMVGGNGQYPWWLHEGMHRNSSEDFSKSKKK